jgi:hypothetical protein
LNLLKQINWYLLKAKIFRHEIFIYIALLILHLKNRLLILLMHILNEIVLLVNWNNIIGKLLSFHYLCQTKILWFDIGNILITYLVIIIIYLFIFFLLPVVIHLLSLSVLLQRFVHFLLYFFLLLIIYNYLSIIIYWWWIWVHI